MTDSADRRIKQRYPADCLRVRFSERGFLRRNKEPLDVSCLNLNRYGMAILSPRPIDCGTRLSLSFQGKYISESRVAARVVNCQPYRTGYRIGLQFSYCFEKNGYSRAVDNALSRIEGIYNRLVG